MTVAWISTRYSQTLDESLRLGRISMKNYFDIEGDGGSDVLGQVKAQRAALSNNLSGVRFRLAIASGKGGVGKSTLGMQLSVALTNLGWSVAVLDADLDGPSQARLGGVGSQPPIPGERGLVMPRNAQGMGVVSLGSFIPEGQALDLPSVAKGESFAWRGIQEATLLRQMMASVEWGELDLLLIDLPPGAERTSQFAELLGPSTALVLVTIPSAISRGVVARSAASVADAPNRLLGYISNMDGYYCSGCGEIRPLFPCAEEIDLDLPLLGRIPFDPDLATLCDRGLPFTQHPDSPSSGAIEKTAARIRSLLEEI